MDNIKNLFNPHDEEISKLLSEYDKYRAVKDIIHKRECADKIYALLFDTVLIHAKFITSLEERLSEGDDFLREFIIQVRKDYAIESEALREVQEVQRQSGLTNAPTE